MKRIKILVGQIENELSGAREYAEQYIELKVDGSAWATKYKEMAQHELTHATTLHDRAVEEIRKVSAVYKAPPEMEETWKLAHEYFMTETEEIKRLITL